MPNLIEDRLTSLLADWIDTNRPEGFPDASALPVHVARRDEIRSRPCVVLNTSESKPIPAMIHRAPFGSLERFTGLLIEHFEGKFPTWLAPEQVRVLPISEKTLEAAEAATARLADAGVRVTIDRTSDKIGAKIRLARLDRVPYTLVLGAREAEEGTVSVRHRDQETLTTQTLEEFVSHITAEINASR